MCFIIFVQDKISEIKLDPNVNLQKDKIVEKDFEQTNLISNSNSNQEDQNFQNKHKNEINLDLNKNNEIFENKDNNFDLFKNEDQTTINKHQIDLTEIEREDEDIDEKVLKFLLF